MLPLKSRGYSLALASAFSFGLMSFLVHAFSGPYPGEQILFVRAVFGALVLFPFVYKEIPKLFQGKAIYIWARAISGGISAVCFFYTLQHTSSANANLLMGSTPVFVSLFSWWLFDEKVSFREGMGIGLVVLGDIFLHLPHDGGISWRVGSVGLIGALLASIAFLTLRQATKQFSANLITFSFCVAAAIASFSWPGQLWQEIHSHSALAMFAAVAVSGLLSQVLMTWAFVWERGPIVTTIGRTSLIWGGIFDALFLGFRPGRAEWASYTTVIIGIILLQKFNTEHK